MSNQNLDDSNDQDQNIKVYDNDEAYMFNEENSNPLNSNRDEGAINENDLNHNQLINYDNQLNNNENEEEEIEEQDLQHPNKDHDEEEGETIRNKQEMRQKHNPDEEEEEEDDQNNQDQENNENEEEDNGEIQLLTLKYISMCQCCKKPFNSSINMPFLFKCGHFFCKKCIEQHFTDEEGIRCPNDGLIGSNMNDLKLLHNLMNDKPAEMQSTRGNFCEIHKGQKLTHYIEDTREMICVYCAFSRFKKNPKYEIKEIKDKCNEICNDVDTVMDENRQHIDLLQSSLNNIKKNKETEEKRVNNLFDQMISYIQNKKSDIINQIETIFSDNAQKLNQKFDIFSTKITNSENLKEMINDLLKNETTSFSEVLDQYNKLLREGNEQTKNSIQIQDYRFSHDEETKLYKYINNFGDLKIVGRGISFGNANSHINCNEEDFGMKPYKMPTQGNIPTNISNHITNPNVNNTSNNNNHMMNISSNNNNNNEMMMNNSELQNNSTYEFRMQNGRESKNKLFPTSNQTKNIMSKYSYNKPMTPGEYRSEFRNYPYALK